MKKKILSLSMAIVIVALSVTVGSFKADEEFSEASTAQNKTYLANEKQSELESFVGEKVTGSQDNGLGNHVDEFFGDGQGQKPNLSQHVSEFVDNKVQKPGNNKDTTNKVNVSQSVDEYISQKHDEQAVRPPRPDLGGAIGAIGSVLGGILENGLKPNSQNTTSVTYSVPIEVPQTIAPVPAGSTMASTTETTEAPIVHETVDFVSAQNPYKRPTEELKPGDKGEGVKWMQWIFIYSRYGLKDNGITGVYDEDTLAAVKKLQTEKGFTPDGICTDKLYDKIDLLYFENTYSETTMPLTSIVAVPTTAGTVASTEADNQGAMNVALLVAIISIIFCVVVAVIFAFVIIKKKKLDKKTVERTTGLGKLDDNVSLNENQDKSQEETKKEEATKEETTKEEPNIESEKKNAVVDIDDIDSIARTQMAIASQQKADAEHRARVRAEAEKKALEKLKAEEKAKEEAERKAKEEAERKAKEEAERKAKEEAERKAKEEAERKAKEEAERKAKEEAERKAKEEAERKAKKEAERKAKEEAERKAKEEAERKAKEKAEKKAQKEAEKKLKKELNSVKENETVDEDIVVKSLEDMLREGKNIPKENNDDK